MEPKPLDRILELQKRVAIKHLETPEIKKRLEFIDASINWLAEFNTLEKASEERRMLGYFLADAFTTLVCARNVILWGAVPDGINLLRSVIESAAIADYVVGENQFQLLKYELEAGGFKRLKFEALRDKKLLDKDLAKEWTSISGLASHTTLKRLELSQFEMDGKTYLRSGVALDPKFVERALGNMCNAALFMVRISRQLLDPLDPKHQGLFDEPQRLEKLHEDLKRSPE